MVFFCKRQRCEIIPLAVRNVKSRFGRALWPEWRILTNETEFDVDNFIRSNDHGRIMQDIDRRPYIEIVAPEIDLDSRRWRGGGCGSERNRG